MPHNYKSGMRILRSQDLLARAEFGGLIRCLLLFRQTQPDLGHLDETGPRFRVLNPGRSVQAFLRKTPIFFCPATRHDPLHDERNWRQLVRAN
jgi:hypothetical protein